MMQIIIIVPVDQVGINSYSGRGFLLPIMLPIMAQ
jgi:hypothetical protein